MLKFVYVELAMVCFETMAASEYGTLRNAETLMVEGLNGRAFEKCSDRLVVELDLLFDRTR